MIRIILAVMVAALSFPAAAAISTFTATLSGLNEAPPNASLGTGFTTVTLDDSADTLRVEITFLGLSGLTAASHIHCCTPPGTNTVVATELPSFTGFPLNVTSGTYDHTFDLTLASTYNPTFLAAQGGTVAGAQAALAAAMSVERAYLNIHTNLFPGGEIRGNLIPEPSTYAFLGLGLVIVAFGARVRQSMR